MDYYIGALKKYVEFNGRARRKEFWMFVLFNFLIIIAISIVESIIGMGKEAYLSKLYNLGILLPSLALGARRLHDINKSGWWQLLAFIPVVGWIILIVFAAQEGQRGDNRYGSDPKAGEEATTNAPVTASQSEPAQASAPQEDTSEQKENITQ